MIRSLLQVAYGIALKIWAPWFNWSYRLMRVITSPFLLLLSQALSRCTSAAYATALLVCTTVVLIWTSIFLYGSFYNSYVPTVSHQRHVNLVFRADCEIPGGKTCSFPSANFSLGSDRNAEILRKGQAYNVILELDMPETPLNQQLGMFMVELTFYSYNGEIINKASRAVSSMLRYKSYLRQIAETVFFLPLYLMRYSEEKQTLDIELFKSYIEDAYLPTIGVFVEVQTRSVHIYNSVLHVNAVFSGLRYFMYNWPLTSSLFGISTIFFFLSIIALLSFLNYGSSKSKSEEPVTFPEYDFSNKPLDLDEIAIAKEKLKTMKEESKQKEEVETIGTDTSATRGTPDGDGSSKDTQISTDFDQLPSSKIGDLLNLRSDCPTLRHRKWTDSMES